MKKVKTSQVAILVLNWVKHSFSLRVSLRVNFRYSLSVRIFEGLLQFPFFISFENFLNISAVLELPLIDFKLLWIVSASFSKSSNSPEAHNSMKRSSAFWWSLDFDFFEGFFNKRLGNIIIALNAISFNGEPCICSLISLFSSTWYNVFSCLTRCSREYVFFPVNNFFIADRYIHLECIRRKFSPYVCCLV